MTSQTLHLDNLAIGDEVRAVRSLSIVIVVACDDEPFSLHDSLLFVVQHRATYSVIALKSQLIGRANDQALLLSILTISVVQCLDERTRLHGEDSPQSLRLQMNGEKSFGIFIRIFVKELTQLCRIMQDTTTLLTHDFAQLHPINVQAIA